VWTFFVDHWCFLPYLALLALLIVMSAWERTPRKRPATTGNPPPRHSSIHLGWENRPSPQRVGGSINRAVLAVPADTSSRPATRRPRR
jgi:hypothetical protein